MSQSNSNLIGSVFERKPTTPQATGHTFNSGKSGFPAVQHRSKSAFARNREQQRKTEIATPRRVPAVISSEKRPKPVDPDGWRMQMTHENEQRVEGMTEEEREEERREIMERFGTGVGDLLERVRQARARQAEHHPEISPPQDCVSSSGALEEVPIAPRRSLEIETTSNRASPPPSALSTSSTRPSSRADRKLRFAALSPQDVHVYESAPPSPRRKILALPPPGDDGAAVSLGQWKSNTGLAQQSLAEPEPEEGTAEYIRRRYFPDAPANDPNLAWMDRSPLPSAPDAASSSLRFDLTGKPVPPSLSSTLPTHLGLHHHADGSLAGYTLDDIFLLSRSSVPAQRATMLDVLARISRRIGRMNQGEISEMSDLIGKEEEMRKRIVAAGVEAMSERGSVGARAIEVLWQCVVGWDEETRGAEELELEVPEDAAINSLPLEFLLPQIAASFAQGDIAEESLSELLDVLYRLAQHSNNIASSITTTPNLVSSTIQTFLLVPFPPTEDSRVPSPLALELLTLLAMSSRSNALALQDPADALLRFITILPPDSPYPPHLSTSILVSTLRFYTALASYGLYSHIAGTAMTHFAQLGQYVGSETCTSPELMAAWAGLLEAWMVCAIDPHRTTPSHDILWSQVIGWEWNTEVEALQSRLGVNEKDWDVWAGMWRVKSAWLEGARINGIKGGLAERLECIEAAKDGFENGKEIDVVHRSLDAIKRELSGLGLISDGQGRLLHFRAVARHANTLMAAIRLWLACLPPLSDGPLASPPFSLPFSKISELCASIVIHPLWSSISTVRSSPHTYVFCRPLSGLLSFYLRLSRRLPGVPEDLWMAQALSILSRLLPGDEEFALQIVEDLTSLLTADWIASRGIEVPWEDGGMSVIKPFLVHTLRPQEDIYIGPACITSRSIMSATTQRFPSATAMLDFGLPVKREWTLSPLDHLLRSGSSSVFKTLPVSWDASEVDIVRVSLSLTRMVREILQRVPLPDFILTREEAIFGCMKVFMLEHGQPQNDSANEVFRDRIVGQSMNDLLRPYTIAAGPVSSSATPVVPPADHGNLEEVAARFLGKTTPFYQYYTDFVAMFDAISFSHPLFGRLLLPPTSMRYAPDYRRHLWNDFGHVLKTIRIPVDQVISENIREYLSPVEQDTQMISAYLRSLLKDSLQGFVQLVALHHVASNIWADLQDDATWSEDRAGKLLTAVVNQGSIDVVREVVRYQQRTNGAALLPPRCFDVLDDEAKITRITCVERWGGKAFLQRLEGLFEE